MLFLNKRFIFRNWQVCIIKSLLVLRKKFSLQKTNVKDEKNGKKITLNN